MAPLTRELGLRDLVLFNIAAVVGIRWIAAAAHAGPGSITLWLLAALFFFIPSALAVSTLSAKFPEEGGIYVWTRQAFGDWHGFLCGWCYWLSNLFYFPQLLLVGVGSAVYALGPAYRHLGDQRGFMLLACLVLLWTALLTHLVGLRVGKWTENLGGLATYLASAIVIGVGGWVWLRHAPATRLDFMPQWSWAKVNFWSQIAFAFGGLELGAVLSGEIRDPRRTVPRAAWISGIAIAGIYILGTTAVLALLHPDQVDIVHGLAQAGSAAGARLGVGWLPAAIGLLIALGATGQLGAWAGGSARLPASAGLDRYLPAAISRIHPRWGTPYVSIIVQGAACSLFLFIAQSGEDLRAAYQLLVDMTIISYFIPFIYLFLAAWRAGRRLSAPLGLTVTIAGIAFSLIPPGEVASLWRYEAKLLIGAAALIIAGRICFVRGGRRGARLRQTPDTAPAIEAPAG